MKKEEINKDFNNKFSELRILLNSWNLIPEAPKNELDSLNFQILSHLYKDATFNKIKRVLKSELSTTYGFYKDEFEAEEIATEIMQWWSSTNKVFE
ncbi:conserved hypothetical protein [Tenacibaculum sp. 190524A02b]|uniref:Uncharacterized protein n=1 Tax=Tenacibaculum vairaonense TaxID=3137860 RepID=A0ABM9PPJ6_9FLAO